MVTLALRPETVLIDTTTRKKYLITDLKWHDSNTRIYRAFDLLRRANQVENVQEIMTFSDTWTPCVALWATFCADEDQATDLRQTVASLQLPPLANLLTILHCFTIGRVMYTITPFMSHGSLVTMMRSRPALREGLPEKAISIALREALNGLMQMHQANVAHKNFGADQILFSSFGGAVPSIKLGHGPLIFRFSTLSEENPELALEQRVAPEIIQIPHLPPPEGMSYQEKELKTDLWMVGVAAMELAYGRFPFATRDSFMQFRDILVRSGKFRFTDDGLKKKKMSPFFQQMVAECFAPLGQHQDARTLKRHIFFATYDKESVTELGKVLLATEG